ncbi:unnamed protein product [Ixodes hexagonus]
MTPLLVWLNHSRQTLASDMKLELLQGSSRTLSFSFPLLCGATFLFKVNVVSKNMQCKMKDIVATTQLLKACSDYIDNYRDVGYETALATANGLAESMGVDSVMKPAPRLRRKKRQFSYECQDEVDDVETKFKREFFYEMIDTVKMSIEERFTQMEQHVSLWGFLYDLSQLPDKAELLKLCQGLDHALRHLESADIGGTDL